MSSIERIFIKQLLPKSEKAFVNGFKIIAKMHGSKFKIHLDLATNCYKIMEGGGLKRRSRWRWCWKKVRKNEVKWRNEIELTRYVANRNLLYLFFKKGIRTCAKNIGDDYLLKLIDLGKKPIVIDCGANIGNLELYLSLNFDTYEYIGFEPDDSAFKCLTLNSQSINCFNVALGNTNNNSQIFYLSSNNGDSSIIKPTIFSETKQVKLVRADQFEPFVNKLESLKIFVKQSDSSMNVVKNSEIRFTTAIDLIKIESEGYELESIQGFGSLIFLSRYIVVDVGLERYGKSTLPSVTNYLLDHGYEVVEIGYPRLTVLYKNKSIK
jgi:FkbM family methyltransferase